MPPVVSQCRAWSFTYDDPPLPLDENALEPQGWARFVYAHWQYELSGDGMHRYAGYVQFNRAVHHGFVFRLLPVTWEPAPGNPITYRCNPVDVLAGPWSVGRLNRGQGQRNDLRALRAARVTDVVED